jgi:hypothetical protein
MKVKKQQIQGIPDNRIKYKYDPYSTGYELSSVIFCKAFTPGKNIDKHGGKTVAEKNGKSEYNEDVQGFKQLPSSPRFYLSELLICQKTAFPCG